MCVCVCVCVCVCARVCACCCFGVVRECEVTARCCCGDVGGRCSNRFRPLGDLDWRRVCVLCVRALPQGRRQSFKERIDAATGASPWLEKALANAAPISARSSGSSVYAQTVTTVQPAINVNALPSYDLVVACCGVLSMVALFPSLIGMCMVNHQACESRPTKAHRLDDGGSSFADVLLCRCFVITHALVCPLCGRHDGVFVSNSDSIA